VNSVRAINILFHGSNKFGVHCYFSKLCKVESFVNIQNMEYACLNLRIFYVSLTVHLSITLANDQLDAKILIHLIQSSICTCFEQYLAHPQEVKLY
jgi:hypothetical protein